MGNPIFPGEGRKSETLSLLHGLAGLPLELRYDSSRRAPSASAAASGVKGAWSDAAGFGGLWFSSTHRRLSVTAGQRGAVASRGDGRLVSFSGNGSGVYTAPTGVNDRLSLVSGGYRYVDAASRSVESYNTAGQLTRLDTAAGQVLTFTYSTTSTPVALAPGAGYLLQVQDAHGRSLLFEYEAVSGSGSTPASARVKAIQDAAGQRIVVAYDAAGNLSSLTWPDGSSRSFVYERSDLPWALTGVLDENGVRKSSFGYDSLGRAVSTELAGGVNRYSVAYTTPPAALVSESYDATAGVVYRVHSWQPPTGTVVTTPNGSSSTLEVASVNGAPRLRSRSQPAGSGCEASTSQLAYDTQGNISSRNDFNGQRVCYAHDLSRNLETVRVEGLASSASCASVTGTGATLPAGSRKVSTQWHPLWRLASRVAEPGRWVTTVYNGQPDPSAGGAVAACAPSDARLPDGSPIAVVCKRIEQATTDATGALGFTASLQAGVAPRVWRYTYNRFGQVLSEDGPRTDVADVTTYTYYDTTTADWTRGDLQQITNPAGQLTQFTRYNPHGQVLQSVDANGLVTDFTYDLRQRLTSVTVAGLTTTYTYEPTGLLQRVTQPDASFVEYHYDAAHRLVALSDASGNRIEYTLDNAGNRIAEQVKDPSGALARQLSRSIDALGRVQQTTGLVH